MQTDESVIAQLMGRQVGAHRIEALLAQGGMGLIFQATPVDNSGARTCVLKVLHHAYQQDPVLCSRFLREGRILAPLQHPNIVAMTACDEDPVLGPYMLMETLHGSTLKELTRARKEPFLPTKIIDWVQQICQALNFCHRKQVVHRDIKPTNIFINSPGEQDEQVKLLDFGIAASPAEPDTPGERVGTPRYMPPEQIRLEAITGQSDIYALGVVLFELLTRRPLFHETESDALKKAHLERQPQRLGDARPDLIYPEALEDLVQRMLAKTPTDRPKSAAALYQELSTVFSAGTIEKKEGRLGIVVGQKDAQAFSADDPTPPPAAATPLHPTPTKPVLGVSHDTAEEPPGVVQAALDASPYASVNYEDTVRTPAAPDPQPHPPTPSWDNIFDATTEGQSPFYDGAASGGQFAAPPDPFAAPGYPVQQPYQQPPAPMMTPVPAPAMGMQQAPQAAPLFQPQPFSHDPLADSLDAMVAYTDEPVGGQGQKALLIVLAGLALLLVVGYILW